MVLCFVSLGMRITFFNYFFFPFFWYTLGFRVSISEAKACLFFQQETHSHKKQEREDT
jgi:hypothetical protein